MFFSFQQFPVIPRTSRAGRIRSGDTGSRGSKDVRRSLGRQGADERRSSPHGWPLQVGVSSCLVCGVRWQGRGELRGQLTLRGAPSKTNGLLDALGDGHGGRWGGWGSIAGVMGGGVRARMGEVQWSSAGLGGPSCCHSCCCCRVGRGSGTQRTRLLQRRERAITRRVHPHPRASARLAPMVRMPPAPDGKIYSATYSNVSTLPPATTTCTLAFACAMHRSR